MTQSGDMPAGRSEEELARLLHQPTSPYDDLGGAIRAAREGTLIYASQTGDKQTIPANTESTKTTDNLVDKVDHPDGEVVPDVWPPEPTKKQRLAFEGASLAIGETLRDVTPPRPTTRTERGGENMPRRNKRIFPKDSDRQLRLMD